MRMNVVSGLVDDGGGDTTRGPHRILLSGGERWSSWAEDDVDGRSCALEEDVAMSGFTSGLTSFAVHSIPSTSDERDSPTQSGSRSRRASCSRDGLDGEVNGGAEQ